MRLTLINQFYTPDSSPTAHLCASLAEHRAALGDDVTVLTSGGGYMKPVAGGNADGGVRVRRLWTPGLGSKTFLRRLIDWLAFHPIALWNAMTLPKQDVVIALTTPPYIALAGAIHKMMHPTCRLILWNMDCYPEAVECNGIIQPGGALSRAMRAMNRWLFRRLDYLICLDAAMADLLSHYAPKDRPLPCSVIPNGERADLFPPSVEGPPWDDPAAEKLRGRFVVLYLGNAGYGHEFQTVIDAAELLRDEPVTFLFVGGGSRMAWIDAQRSRRELTNIVLHDYVPKEQTPAVMRAAHCALITLEDASLGVMSPSKLHANLAMGLPVIYVGPEKSNVDEAIRQFNCGISVRVGEGKELSNFIRQIRTDARAIEDMSRSARDAFENAYCDQRTLPRFDEILEAALKLNMSSGQNL